MRPITPRYPLRRDNRVIIGVALTTDYQQGFQDGQSEGKYFGISPLSAALGAAGLYAWQYYQKHKKS